MEVTCIYGTYQTTVEVNENQKLSELRSLINNKSSDPIPEEDGCRYRFVSSTISDEELEDSVVHSIVSSKYEMRILISDIIDNANKTVRMVNIAAQKNPDLLGVKTSGWRYGDITVACKKASNESVPFDPIMLEHVIAPYSTDGTESKSQTAIYDNVCICTPNANVGFHLTVSNHLGYKYSIKIDTGEYIVSGLYRTNSEAKKATLSSWIERWQGDSKKIQISKFSDLKLDNDKVVQYQRVTFEFYEVVSFKNSDKKVITLANSLSVASNSDTIVVPGEPITPGSPTKGDDSSQRFGTIYGAVVGDKIGEVTIWFFVFKSLKEAKAYFNMQDPIKSLYVL